LEEKSTQNGAPVQTQSAQNNNLSQWQAQKGLVMLKMPKEGKKRYTRWGTAFCSACNLSTKTARVSGICSCSFLLN